jgi:hypothetical protein
VKEKKDRGQVAYEAFKALPATQKDALEWPRLMQAERDEWAAIETAVLDAYAPDCVSRYVEAYEKSVREGKPPQNITDPSKPTKPLASDACPKCGKSAFSSAHTRNYKMTGPERRKLHETSPGDPALNAEVVVWCDGSEADI